MSTIKYNELEALRAAFGEPLASRLSKVGRILECVGANITGPTLEAGRQVVFKCRGKELPGLIGAVSGDGTKLYIYVANPDGFGTTGYRVQSAAVVQPEVELTDEQDEAVEFARGLLKVADKHAFGKV